MARPRFYYTLAIREDGIWSPQFGDYSWSCVADERTYRTESGEFIRRDAKIVRSYDDQASINAAVAALNIAPDRVAAEGVE